MPSLLRPCLSLTVGLLFAVRISLGADANVNPVPQAETPRAPLRSLSVFPAKVDLDGPRAEQRLSVLGDYANGRRWDLSRQATYRSAADNIARVDEHGILHPIADGETEIEIAVQGQTAKVPVRVKGAKAETLVEFKREVLPVLTRAGCNAGACHGAALGRGGFRLSLLGYDPAFDHAQIVQSAEGRRVVLSDPERSILLLKPTLALEHVGGERFTSR